MTDLVYPTNAETVKLQVTAVSTGNLTLSGEQTLDGVSVVSGNRVLAKNQTAGAENGIWVADAGAWIRASDFTSNQASRRTRVFVKDGTAYAGTTWELTNSGDVTIGGDALTFALTSSPVTALGVEKTDPDGSEHFAIEDAGTPKYVTILNADKGMVHTSTADPTANDDSGDTSGNGVFHVGQRWVNTQDDKVFHLANATTGGAVWRESLHTGAETLSTSGTLADTARTHWLASTAAGVTITLPDPTARSGDEHVLTCVSSGYTCTVAGSMYGSTTEVIYPDESFSLKSDGTYWRFSG